MWTPKWLECRATAEDAARTITIAILIRNWELRIFVRRWNPRAWRAIKAIGDRRTRDGSATS